MSEKQIKEVESTLATLQGSDTGLDSQLTDKVAYAYRGLDRVTRLHYANESVSDVGVVTPLVLPGKTAKLTDLAHEVVQPNRGLSAVTADTDGTLVLGATAMSVTEYTTTASVIGTTGVPPLPVKITTIGPLVNVRVVGGAAVATATNVSLSFASALPPSADSYISFPLPMYNSGVLLTGRARASGATFNTMLLDFANSTTHEIAAGNVNIGGICGFDGFEFTYLAY